MPTLIEQPVRPAPASSAILPPEMSPAELTLSFGNVEFTLNPSDIEAEVSYKNNGKGVLLSLENFSGSLQVSLKKASSSTNSSVNLATVEVEPNSPPTAPKAPKVSSVQQRLPFPKQKSNNGGGSDGSGGGGKARMRRKVEHNKPPKERKRSVESKTTKPAVKKCRVETKIDNKKAAVKIPVAKTSVPAGAAACQPMETEPTQPTQKTVDGNSTMPSQAQNIADLSQTMGTSQSTSRSSSGMFQAAAGAQNHDHSAPTDSVTEILNRIHDSNDSVATVQGDEECNSIASIAASPDGEEVGELMTDPAVEQENSTMTANANNEGSLSDAELQMQTLSPTMGTEIAAATATTTTTTTEIVSKVSSKAPTTPCPRWGHTMTKLENNRLLIYGGQSFDLNGSPIILSDVHYYDPVEKKWSKPINSRGEARQWHSSTYLPNRKLLITFGGETLDPIKNKVVTSDTIRVFDKEISLWFPPSVSGDVPSGRSGHTLTHLPESNQLILFGGVKGSRWLNNLAVLDTSSWIWSVPKVHGFAPKSRSYHSATAVKGKDGCYKLVFFGGNNKSSSFNSVHALEIREEGWRWTHPSVSGKAPFPRTGHSAVLLDDGKTINIYGGWDPNEEDDVETGEDCIHKSSFLLDTEIWTWTAGPKVEPGVSGTETDFVEDCGPKRCGHTAALNSERGEIVVFGGRIPGERLAGDLQFMAAPKTSDGLNDK